MKPEADNAQKPFEVKVYTTKELRELYQVPYRTFERWLKPYKEAWGFFKGQKYLTTKQVKFIVDTFGLPEKMSR